MLKYLTVHLLNRLTVLRLEPMSSKDAQIASNLSLFRSKLISTKHLRYDRMKAYVGPLIVQRI